MRKFSLSLFSIFVHFIVFSQSRLQVVPDTVRILNGELVIRNASRNVEGFLYNTGNGITVFKPLDYGKSIQFTVGGDASFPQAGDTAYSTTDLIQKNIKVWRNGLFQYRDRVNGIAVDSTQGKIVFYPALVQGDKVYIEGLSGVTLLVGAAPTGTVETPNISELNGGIFVSGNNFVLRWASNATTLTSAPKVIGIGSSTLAGYGLSAPNRLGDKIQAWLTSNTTAPVWVNLGVSGQNSGNLLPVAEGGVPGNNIEGALLQNPDFIFVCLPSNDPASGISVVQSMANYRRMDELAKAQGVPVFFETTQPRTAYNETMQLMLKQLADSIRTNWPNRYVEGFLNLVDNSSGTSAAILPQYAQADGIHLTSDGNQLVANELFARWQSFFQPITGVQQYVIESSTDGNTWSSFDVVTNQNLVKKQFTRTGNNAMYFRIKANFINGGSTPYSNVITLPAVEEDPGGGDTSQNGNTMRILVDLGGDGVTTMNGTLIDGKRVPAPDSFGKYWNNWTGTSNLGFVNGSAIYNLVSATNQQTPLSITLLGNPFGTFYGTAVTRGVNYNGFNAPVGDYPLEAVYDNMFVNSSSTSAGNTLRIKNMQPGAVYTIKLWGARIDDAGSSRFLEVKLGDQSWNNRSFETRYLSTDTARYEQAYTFTAITGMDSLDINFRTAPGSSFGHLSLIDITVSGYSNAGFPAAQYNDTTVSLPQASLQLTGNINTMGQSISSYSWEQLSGPSTTTITNGNTAQPSITGLTNGVYAYRVYVTLANNQLLVDELTVTVMPDNAGLKTMRVHFSNTPAPSVPGWVNAAGPVTGNFIQITDTTTGWGLNNGGTTVNYWNPLGGTNGADNLGESTGNNSGIVPDIVLRSYWYNSNRPYSATYPGNVILVGLNPAKTYTLKLVGSRDDAGAPPRYSAWRINGGIEYLQNAHGNTSLQTVIPNIAPDANGVIRIGVFTPANTSTYGQYSYLNALIVQEEE